MRAAILIRKAALDAATGTKPNPRAFLAENHVTGIRRTNGTQTKKNALSTLLKPPEKDKQDGVVFLRFTGFRFSVFG
jgi:hypothetical protein